MEKNIISQIKKIPVEDLYFDLNNPRLVEFEGLPKKSEEEIIQILWEAMDVKELVLSIYHNGYFDNDPLLVAQENGKNIVVEGNRRLASVKVLLNPEKYTYEVPRLSVNQKKELKKLPVIEKTRKDAWEYIGFKHVNGPAKWGSYAKARYITQVHNEYGVSLDDIAAMIGDTHKTVRKLYRGLMVVEQAEKLTEFKRDDAIKSRFPFSHLYTALGYDGYSDYLGVKSENEDTKEFIPKERTEQLEETFNWLYGSKKANQQPIIQSQNPDLRILNAVIRHPEAVLVLRRYRNLGQAYELTKPAGNILQEELLNAKTSLIKAKGYLTEGYDGSQQILKMAGTIADLADTIYDEMEKMQRKNKPEKKKRITEK